MCSFQYLVNVGEDCPVFDGMFEFCQVSAGGSLGKVAMVTLEQFTSPAIPFIITF